MCNKISLENIKSLPSDKTLTAVKVNYRKNKK